MWWFVNAQGVVDHAQGGYVDGSLLGETALLVRCLFGPGFFSLLGFITFGMNLSLRFTVSRLAEYIVSYGEILGMGWDERILSIGLRGK